MDNMIIVHMLQNGKNNLEICIDNTIMFFENISFTLTLLHQKIPRNLFSVFFYPSHRLGISSDFYLYLITVGTYHHALAYIHLRLDDIHTTGAICYRSSIFIK